MTLATAIARLRHFQATLADPLAFYATHRERWQTLVREITHTAVLQFCPPEADHDSWAAKAATLASKVTASLLTTGDPGVLLALRSEVESSTDLSPGDPAFTSAGISIEDLVRFIQAGEAGEPLGKRLDERDAGKSELQIAWRMMYAIKRRKGNWESLVGHIREFLGNSEDVEDSAVEALATHLLETWVKLFVPLAIAHFRTWLRLQIQILEA